MTTETKFQEDAMRWHGRELTGEYAHYCWDWDALPIDETCMEITGCSCYSGEDFNKARDPQFKELDKWNAEHPPMDRVEAKGRGI